eukprot:CCRYP_015403-RA/>CCRYP_015403-RA protein AED:0.41 eAED:0.65 QI:0/0/0.5/1/0/0/2/266/95
MLAGSTKCLSSSRVTDANRRQLEDSSLSLAGGGADIRKVRLRTVVARERASLAERCHRDRTLLLEESINRSSKSDIRCSGPEWTLANIANKQSKE